METAPDLPALASGDGAGALWPPAACGARGESPALPGPRQGVH